MSWYLIAIGIGGDPIIGTTTKDAMNLFLNDDETDCVGNWRNWRSIGVEASKYVLDNGNKKPVVGFIAGETAPKAEQWPRKR